MQPSASPRRAPGIGSRLLVLALGFVILTGQASTDGCGSSSESGGQTPSPASEPDAGPSAPPAAAEIGSSATGRVHTAWPAIGHIEPGTEVLYRSSGSTYARGVVREIGDPTSGAMRDTYLVHDQVMGSWSYERHHVARAQREPFWTEFFFGDWEIRIPSAMNIRTDGYDVYRVVSGGMSLPPLRVNRNGTYSWRTLGTGGEQVIEGRWAAREDGPGIILLGGAEGVDWTVTNVTDKSTLKVSGRAEVHLTTPSITYMSGSRIMSESVRSASVGDTLIYVRNDGRQMPVRVAEARDGRFRVEDYNFQMLTNEWVALDRLRVREQ